MTTPSERGLSQLPDFYPSSDQEKDKNVSYYSRLKGKGKSEFQLFKNRDNTLGLSIIKIDNLSKVHSDLPIPKGFNEPLVIISFIHRIEKFEYIYFNRNGYALKEIIQTVNGQRQSSYSHLNKEDYEEIDEALVHLESKTLQMVKTL